jgi:p24 family protein beta-1
MTVTYQVAGASSSSELDIDFWMKGPGPNPTELVRHKKRDTGTYSFTADKSGRYEYCFRNEGSGFVGSILGGDHGGRTLSFNVHGILYIDDEGHVAPIEKEIRALSQALAVIKDEQEYIVVRERLHRDTAESTNERVKWWTVIQTILLIVVCGWQVWYLKRFFEVKRVI